MEKKDLIKFAVIALAATVGTVAGIAAINWYKGRKTVKPVVAPAPAATA